MRHQGGEQIRDYLQVDKKFLMDGDELGLEQAKIPQVGSIARQNRAF
jgi:hypothetical protein